MCVGELMATEHGSAAAKRSETPVAAQAPRARALGVNAARAIGSARSVVRANPTLREMRTDAANALRVALERTKPESLAAGLNATRTLVVRWLDATWVDRRPAPLALLLALDDADFDAVVTELRKARASRR